MSKTEFSYPFQDLGFTKYVINLIEKWAWTCLSLNRLIFYLFPLMCYVPLESGIFDIFLSVFVFSNFRTEEAY